MKQTEPVDTALNRVRDLHWDDQAATARVAERLAQQPQRSSYSRRLPVLPIILLGAFLLLGAGAAGTYIAIQKARLYEITVREEGEVTAQPRILTVPGQPAQLTITEEDGSQTTINIDEHGNVTVISDDDDPDVEVNISEVPVPQPVQRLYTITIAAAGDGEVIGTPRVMVNAGETAELTIAEQGEPTLRVYIDARGSVEVTGRDDVVVDVKVVEIDPAPARDEW